MRNFTSDPDDSYDDDQAQARTTASYANVQHVDFGSDKEEDDEVTMSRDWFNMTEEETQGEMGASDEPMPIPVIVPKLTVNQWEVRKQNAIKVAAAQAEDKAARQYWQARKDEGDAAKTINDKDNASFKEAIVSDTAKEFQRLRATCAAKS